MFILPLLGACTGPFSTLDAAGPAATQVAWVWWAMFWFATLVWLGVIGLWIAAVKRRPHEQTAAARQRLQTRWIYWGGLALPLASITVLLFFGIPVGHSMLPLPVADGEVLRIDVTGHQWRWEVRYPDSGIELENELHIPTGTPIDLHLTSNDVIHSFWVPRLGGKVDMLPARTNVLRLEADAPGIYRGQCAEFCGLGHAHMKFTVTAHAPDDFATWLTETAND
ncbi:MAG: cytochrome c oxidase subunit II [Natronospirillum sp.]